MSHCSLINRVNHICRILIQNKQIVRDFVDLALNCVYKPQVVEFVNFEASTCCLLHNWTHQSGVNDIFTICVLKVDLVLQNLIAVTHIQKLVSKVVVCMSGPSQSSD